MVLKYILLASVCWTLNNDTKCNQRIKFNLSDASACTELADRSGKSFKGRIEELGGSMTEYRVHCIAIDSQGYNVDESFKISYTIL
jgi:hypothetical protein